MKLHVWLSKLMMILHIRGLKEDSLTKKIWREQLTMEWPGLAKECSEICQKLKIDNCNETELKKKDYRSQDLSACHLENERRLRQAMEDKDKCARIGTETYGRKLYFNSKTPSETREMFATRVFMKPWAGNFKNDRRFARTGWMCRCGGSMEQEEHVVTACPMYMDLSRSTAI